MGFFSSNSEPKYDFGFIDKEIDEMLNDWQVVVFDDEKSVCYRFSL
jgi:hypothetical protein